MSTTATLPSERAPLHKSLFVQVIAGLLAGILVGVLAPGLAGELKVLSDAFLRLIAMIVAPRLNSDSSSAAGRRTLRTRSASRAASEALPAISAPAASYSASRIPAFRPAPACTVMSAPSVLNFFTVSGTAATRGSAESVSDSTAMRMRGFPCISLASRMREPARIFETRKKVALME